MKLQSNEDRMKHGTVVKVPEIDISCVYMFSSSYIRFTFNGHKLNLYVEYCT